MLASQKELKKFYSLTNFTQGWHYFFLERLRIHQKNHLGWVFFWCVKVLNHGLIFFHTHKITHIFVSVSQVVFFKECVHFT